MEQVVIVDNPMTVQRVCDAMVGGYPMTVPGEAGTGMHGYIRKIERMSPRTFHVTVHE